MRGACPPPPAPPASGKVPVPGTGRSTGGGVVGRRGRKIRNNVKLSSRFSAEKQLHVFAPACRLQSIGEGVRACREYVKSWEGLVRGETRRKSPLSLPRTPLFYAERERGAGGAQLPSGISRRNAVTTHIPGGGTLLPLFCAERYKSGNHIFDKLSSCGSFGFSHWKFIFISYIIQ